jgi:hypothetical protein
MAPIHIDEAAGSDTAGTGTPDQPYQTLGLALFNHGASESFLTRKDSSVTYEEPTQSSLKKAKKTAEGIEKKRKKQEELAERDAKEKGEERERKEKLLEESKKNVLEEDSALPRATKVRTKLPITDALLKSLPVENRSSLRTAIETNPCLWMGASFASTKRYHLHCPPRRHRLPPDSAVWESCMWS